MVLYADDTSITITDTDKSNLQTYKFMVQCQFAYFKLPENPILGILVYELL
jgi:hypothetical protein